MKFENIKVGMKLQHKESGLYYDVIDSGCKYFQYFVLNGYYYDGGMESRRIYKDIDDAKLFTNARG